MQCNGIEGFDIVLDFTLLHQGKLLVSYLFECFVALIYSQVNRNNRLLNLDLIIRQFTVFMRQPMSYILRYASHLGRRNG